MENSRKEFKMTLMQKRWIVIFIIVVLGFLLGRLAVRAFMNLLMEKEEEVRKKYNTRITVVAITTKTRGNLIDAWGIDLD